MNVHLSTVPRRAKPRGCALGLPCRRAIVPKLRAKITGVATLMGAEKPYFLKPSAFERIANRAVGMLLRLGIGLGNS